eukprot:TRINITY_DN750_c0_g1_i1.p1 TRINITY_DN750_c0_g1~~TRINITY_DN750_c0_g1_i1.p1  ORF type:complete len:272 (+),score=74.59 TRINITY_DN750_c0_g1_i1:50-865(+)
MAAMDKIKMMGRDLEDTLRPYRSRLPDFARLLMLATFIEDGFRILFQWDLQTRYLTGQLQYSNSLSYIILLLSIAAQLGASTMIMLKKHVVPALASLGVFIVLQMIVYYKVLDSVFFVRNLSLLGGLLLLYVFVNVEKERNANLAIFYNLADKKYENWMQLAGRLLLIFLTASVIYGELSISRIVFGILGGVLCLMVIVGFKTTFSAFLLIVFLAFANLIVHNFWTLDHKHQDREYQKYYFFQTTSVMGGLLLLVYLGPGKFSIDEKNKDL